MCAHQNLAAVDAALDAGAEGVRAIAKRFGLSKSAVDRHKRQCRGENGASESATAEASPPEPRSGVPASQTVPVKPRDERSEAAPKPAKTTRAHVPAIGTLPAEAVEAVAEVFVPSLGRDVDGELDGTPTEYRHRVEHIANLMASGRWLGRPTAKRLGQEWGISVGAVHKLRQAAGVVLAAPREELAATLAENLGRLDHQYAVANAAVTGGVCDHCKRTGPKDARALAELLSFMRANTEQRAKLDGSLQSKPPAVVVNLQTVMRDPTTARLFAVFGRALRRSLSSELQTKVMEAVRAEFEAAQGEGAPRELVGG